MLADCAALGVPFVTVFSAGFSETGTPEGRERQAKLLAFARESGMRIMGPNCNGVINFVDAFAMTSTAAIMGPRAAPRERRHRQPERRPRARSTSCGARRRSGSAISYEASSGNEADLDTLDFARFMLRSDATDIVLMAIEGIKDGEKFREVAHEAAEREKPIVVLKLGSTQAGSRAAASHTGAIAGDDDIFDAVVAPVRAHPRARGRRISTRPRCCCASAAGRKGAARLRCRRPAATSCRSPTRATRSASSGRSIPPETQAALAQLLPGYGKVANPTDMTSLATGQRELYRSALEAIAADPAVDVMVPIYASGTKDDLQRGADFVTRCEKVAAMLWVGGCNDDAAFTPKDFVKAGVPVYRDATPCMRAMRAAMDFGDYVRLHKSGRANPERPAGIDREAALALLRGFGDKLTEREAKQVLAAYGFPVTREKLASDAGRGREPRARDRRRGRAQDRFARHRAQDRGRRDTARRAGRRRGARGVRARSSKRRGATRPTPA